MFTGHQLQEQALEGEWIAAIRQKLDEGQGFLVYDMVRAAIQHYPDSLRILLMGTLALFRSGAEEEARKLLAPRTSATLGDDDLETLKLLGEIHFEGWLRGFHNDDLHRSQQAFLESFRRDNALETGIDAVFLTWLMGLQQQADPMARQVIILCQQEWQSPVAHRRFLARVTAAEAHLLLGHQDTALAMYQEAITLPAIHYTWVAKSRARLALMTERGVPVVPEVAAILPPPVVVVFAGQELDRPGQVDPFFPPHLEQVVKDAIHLRLEQLKADIGYCSAACGADLLFIEAMIERHAEVNIFLPCAVEDFMAACVQYAGPHWEQRFHRLLQLATTIHFATEERLLGHQLLFRFNNQIINGMARLRAQQLDTEPHLLLVWDYAAQNLAGTAADFMDQWPDIGRLRLIDLDELRELHPLPESDTATLSSDGQQALLGSVQQPERVIKTMLFADIVGFSKLKEEDLPGLWRFLATIHEQLLQQCAIPDLVESWGDALYVVQSSASDMLRYAFALQQGFSACHPADFGLPYPLQLRIGLHAGPVYTGVHPLTGREMIYGSHVSRTARIEPVTVPGQIYASQQFVALLTMEESAPQHRQLSLGQSYPPWYFCTYLGVQNLAKNYGSQPVYHLRAVA
ncbi:MAG: adenylate/guanylate cyclase domain-containing protein [Magnetococcales bacterium]|nr:adenylate/guanylate cyclase domain-containing protein [Magnetococcales bacterium]